MNGRATAGRGRRGGESIPPLRALFARLSVAFLALALAAGLAVYPALHAGRLAPLVYSLAAVAFCFLAPLLLWHGRGAWLPVFLLMLEYVLAESFGSAGSSSMPVYTAGLIVLCELLFWSAELPLSARIDPAVVGGRLLSLALIALGAVAVALVALASSRLQMSSALLAAVLGSLAAALLLAIPWLLLRGRGPASPDGRSH